MSEEFEKIICENNCLYNKNFYLPYCETCNNHVKDVLGFKLAMLFWKKFEDETENTLYHQGIKQGLLLAQGIVRGEDPKYWIQ